jgi:hypothetical protein
MEEGPRGGLLLSETIRYDHKALSFRYSGAKEESRAGRHPMAVAALGRNGMDALGRPRWYFEIRYRAVFHEPGRMGSFPADNAFMTRAIGWEWGFYL